MIPHTFKKRGVSLLVAASACCSGIVHAQLEEVIVTAQKREQSLQDVPISVSAMSGDQLNAAGVNTIEGLAKIMPSLEVQSTTSTVSANFRIRRVGNLGNIPDFEPAVGVFQDGAFRSRSIFGMGDLFNVERVEVLRGPQSTLYGKNVTAGVVAIYTAPPSEEFEWKGELTGGNMEGANDAALYRFKGGVSGPLTDSLGASLGGSYAYRDKLQSQAVAGGADTNELERYSLRGELNWDATDKLNLRAIAGTVQQDDNEATSNDYFYDPDGYIAGFVLPTLQGAGLGVPCTDNDPKNRKACNLDQTTTDLDSSEAILLANYQLDNGWSIDSITSWDYYKFEGTQDDAGQIMTPVLRYHDTQEGEAWQQELRLTSAGGETVDWMAGAFYYHNEFKRGDDGDRAVFLYDTLSDDPTVAAINQAVLETPFPVPFATQGQLSYVDGRQDTDYYAIYGQVAWQLTDKMKITGGLRWQREEKDASVQQTVNDPSPSIISLLLSPTEISADNLDRSKDKVTWSISPQYFLTDDIMIYATASRGFKSGGFNTSWGAVEIDAREFQDEKVTNYEAGVKTTLLDGNLRLNVDVFHTEYKEYQEAAFVGANFTVGNAEKATTKGAELEGVLLLGEHFTTDFGVSYADLEYDEFTGGQCYPGRAPDSPTNPTACDLSGENPINAPKWKTHLGLTYETPVSWGDVYARADWTWSDDYNTSFSADPLLEQSSYSWVSARIGTHWNNWEFVVWCDNLTDEDVSNVEATANIYSGDNSFQSFLQPPRSYGLTIRANY